MAEPGRRGRWNRDAPCLEVWRFRLGGDVKARPLAGGSPMVVGRLKLRSLLWRWNSLACGALRKFPVSLSVCTCSANDGKGSLDGERWTCWSNTAGPCFGADLPRVQSRSDLDRGSV